MACSDRQVGPCPRRRDGSITRVVARCDDDHEPLGLADAMTWLAYAMHMAPCCGDCRFLTGSADRSEVRQLLVDDGGVVAHWSPPGCSPGRADGPGSGRRSAATGCVPARGSRGTAWGRQLRLMGQNREPTPPAMITQYVWSVAHAAGQGTAGAHDAFRATMSGPLHLHLGQRVDENRLRRSFRAVALDSACAVGGP
jgi:hypothetical protein